MSEKITDEELIMLIQEHANGKEVDDQLIFRAAIELKTYRDLEKHGVLTMADWAKKGGAK